MFHSIAGHVSLSTPPLFQTASDKKNNKKEKKKRNEQLFHWRYSKVKSTTNGADFHSYNFHNKRNRSINIEVQALFLLFLFLV